MKNLIIVESPAKAKTIGRFLGSGAQVMASMGHISDLPQRNLGIDLDNHFLPQYELTANGKKVMRSLSSAAKTADKIYLATDPDREGEAIAWHLQRELSKVGRAPFYRISFHEITRSAISNSFASAGDVNQAMVDAQQARRVLDRLVGYQVSPLLWRNIQKNTSAGRVQTVALRLIVEREREIQQFKPEEYWTMDALFQAPGAASPIKMRLTRINDEKASVPDQSSAENLARGLQSEDCRHIISKVSSVPRQQHAMPPFITSTLQQAAGSNLKFGTSVTMKLAQELYEGIDIGQNGETGLITYMRTDSVNVSQEAQAAARSYIESHYGKEYVPSRPNIYKSRNTAQEAHEAIRPTDINRTPESIADYLTPQQLKLYRLIWMRFLASQMASADQMDHSIEVESSGAVLSGMSVTGLKAPAITNCTFRASYRETVFPGHLAVYNMSDLNEDKPDKNGNRRLPKLAEGGLCILQELLKEQCFTTPPNRYSEAALVKALEQNGVGRPSTYATTVKTICDREYVSKAKGPLMPTELGFKVCDYLVQQMPDLFNIGFTAQMESELDGIEEGQLNWTDMLSGFYGKFKVWMQGMGEAGRHLAAPVTLSESSAKKLSEIFTSDFAYTAATTVNGRRYDDKKLVESLQKQIAEGKKPLSDKQCAAIFNMAGRYAAKSPELLSRIEAMGLKDQIASVISSQKLQEEEREQKPRQQLAPELTRLLDAMKSVEWAPAAKRGARTYDDGKFYKSICSSASSRGELSAAQIAAVKKLAAKYAAMIPGYAELAELLGLAPTSAPHADAAPETNGNETTAAAPEIDSGTARKAQLLISLGESIQKWHEPTGTGKRKFDDKEFFASVASQFKQKGQLSDRQLNALAKVIGRYAQEIPDYESRISLLGESASASSQDVNETCPECGSPLVRRFARGRAFIGCSGYPKCHYIKK